MKQKTILLILINLIAVGAFALLSYDIEMPEPFVRGDVIDNQLPKTYNPGEPGIPYKSIKILLPQGERYVDTKVTFTSLRMIDNIYIDYVQEPLPISQSNWSTTQRNENIYNRNEFYPYKDFDVVGVQRKNGYDILMLNVYPYKYNPVTSTLSWHESFNIEIETKVDDELAYQQNRFLVNSNRIQQSVARLVHNPELLNSYAKTNLRHSPILPKLDEPYQMIVISSREKEEVFEEYIEWRTDKGITTGFFTTQDIYELYEGDNRPEQIRNFIIDAYLAYAQTETPLEYVILGGDAKIIPIRGMYGKVGKTVDRAMPADIYYSNLDGDWDANGNGIYGEEDDKIDLFAEVALGRIPANSDSQFRNFFHKNYYYVENNTYSNDIVCMIGEKLDENPTYGGDYKDDIIPLIPDKYKIKTLYERDETFSSNAVVDAINSGIGIINHIGHSFFSLVFGLNNSRIYSLKNSEYGFAYTQGCYPAAFDPATSQESGCVGQNLTIAKGGLFAFIGNTRYGWYMPGSTQGPSQAFDITFFQGLYDENIRELGHTMNYSKEELAEIAATNDVMRWVYYVLVLFGDPSIAVKSPFGEYPYVEPTDIVVSDVEGDNDGYPNPGETIEVFVELGVDDDWGDAYDVKAKVFSNEPYFDIIKDAVEYGVILRGETKVNENEPFLIEISENTPLKDFVLNLELSAVGAQNTSFTSVYYFTVPVTLIQNNWPWRSDFPITASPVFTQLNGETDKQLIVVDDIGNINFLDSDGNPTQDEIVSEQTLWRSFAVGKLNNENEKNIVLASRKEKVLAISASGDTTFVFDLCGEQVLTPILADLNGDGNNEIISFGIDKHLYVLDTNGDLMPGFPVVLPQTALADLGVADLNDDGFKEILIGTLDRKLYAIDYRGNALDGFPVDLPSSITTAPTILNNKSIAVFTSNSQLLLISNEGKILFEREIPGRVSGEIIAGDFNNSEELQLAFVTNKGEVYIVKQDGADLEGWPVKLNTPLFFPPLAVDLNGDGFGNLICYSSMGQVYAFHPDGSMLNSFPVPLHDNITSPAIVADIDNDGDFDLVIATSSGITVIDYKTPAGNKVHWGMYRNNEKRDGYWGDQPLTNIDRVTPILVETLLKQNYPNPFNPDTNIEFSIKDDDDVELEVYNIKGQRVKTLINEKLERGKHSVVWNGTDHYNRAVGSGIYLLRLKTNEKTLSRKMMLLK
ncbi:MAG: C25 family cysteine peptidase [Candidatus Cloacimonas sp.]|nr:C25 family cysteine peptidase [Candidatus Cloacimonadota bacterium]